MFATSRHSADFRKASPLVGLHRPLLLGASIGHPKGTVGSIGPFVRMPHNRTGFVAGSYVLAPAGSALDDWIHQPGPHDAGLLTGSTRIGRLAATAPPRRLGLSETASAVVALDVEVAGNCVPAFLDAPEAGRSILGVADVAAGDEVAFIGSTSGYSRGRVAAIHRELAVAEFTFANVVEIVADDGHFSDAGDGGALVFRCGDLMAVGLLFARETVSEGNSISYALPLQPTLDALDVTLLS